MLIRKRRRGKKSRRSMWDDFVVYIALGTLLIASLTAFALWVALPTLRGIWIRRPTTTRLVRRPGRIIIMPKIIIAGKFQHDNV